ncbi:MAG: hypothetical protein C0601_08990, partial [Candidatus Muiribacterium halophilum]
MNESVAIKQIIEDLLSGDSEIQKTAAKACYNMKDPSLIPYLKGACKSDNTGVRYFAKKSLFHILESLRKTDDHDLEKIKSLTEKKIYDMILNGDSDELLLAIRAIKQERKVNNQILDALCNVLKKEENEYVISNIISVFSMFSYKKVYPLLIDKLRYKDLRVVANTIEALQYYKSSKTIFILTQFLKHKDNRIKANALSVLMKFSVEGIQKQLVKMLHNGKLWEMDSALYAMIQIDPVVFESEFEWVLTNESDEAIIQKAIDGLQKCKTETAR